LAWNNFYPSTGFSACVLLDVGQNSLSGTLPAGLSALGAGLGLSLYDNAFTGTVPASYANLAWVALANNSLIEGPMPSGLNYV